MPLIKKKKTDSEDAPAKKGKTVTLEGLKLLIEEVKEQQDATAAKLEELITDLNEETPAEGEEAAEGEETTEETEETTEEADDLAELDRAGLKALIKEEELDVKVLKSMSDDDLREAVRAARPEEEAEAETEEAEGEEAETEEGEATDDEKDAGEEVPLPTVAEIKKADVAQLKEWRKTLFDKSDSKQPLSWIKATLLKNAEGEGEAEETEGEETEGEEAETEEAETEGEEEESEDKPKGKSKNSFGLKFDDDGHVTNVKEKNHLDCKTDLDKVVKLANTYSCVSSEPKCLCAKGDKKKIAKCWAEWLADSENAKIIAKERAAKKGAPAEPAKKGKLLKRRTK